MQRVDIKVQRFDSVKELEDYTNETDKFFPSHVARGDKLLRWLLRPLHKDREPEPDDNENQKPKSKRNRRKGGKKPGGGTQNDQGGNQDGTPSKRRRRRRRNKKAAAPETPSNPIQPTMSSTST